MSKIQQWSHRFRIFFQILLILTPIAVIAFWVAPAIVGAPLPFLGPDFAPNFTPDAGNLNAMTQHWSAGARVIACLLTFIPVGISMLILAKLIRLFRLYEQNIIFTSQNVVCIRSIGILMLIKAAIYPFYQALITLTLSWQNAPGQKFIAVNVTRTQLESIVMALMIILISWIMLEGAKLHEEQTLTV